MLGENPSGPSGRPTAGTWPSLGLCSRRIKRLRRGDLHCVTAHLVSGKTGRAERAFRTHSSLFAEQVLCFTCISGGNGCISLGAVQLHELGQIELGLLQDLDLADEYVLKGEDLGAFLVNLLANLIGEPIA